MMDPMVWHDRGNELQTIRCPGGPTHFWKESADFCAEKLKGLEKRFPDMNAYAFGDRVSDPMAVVMRFLTLSGWRAIGPGRMMCPMCRRKQEAE